MRSAKKKGAARSKLLSADGCAAAGKSTENLYDLAHSRRRLSWLCFCFYWLSFAEEMPTTAIGLLMTVRMNISPARQTLYYSAAFTCFSMMPLLAVFVEYCAKTRCFQLRDGRQNDAHSAERIKKRFAVGGVAIGGGMYLLIAVLVRRPFWLFTWVTLALNLALAFAFAVLDGIAVEISNAHSKANAHNSESEIDARNESPEMAAVSNANSSNSSAKWWRNCGELITPSNVQNGCLISRSLGSLSAAALVICLHRFGNSSIIAFSACVYLCIALPLVSQLPTRHKCEQHSAERRSDSGPMPKPKKTEMSYSSLETPSPPPRSDALVKGIGQSDDSFVYSDSDSDYYSAALSSAIDSGDDNWQSTARAMTALLCTHLWALVFDHFVPIWKPLLFLFALNSVPSFGDVFYVYIYSDTALEMWQFRLFKFTGLLGALCGALLYYAILGDRRKPAEENSERPSVDRMVLEVASDSSEDEDYYGAVESMRSVKESRSQRLAADISMQNMRKVSIHVTGDQVAVQWPAAAQSSASDSKAIVKRLKYVLLFAQVIVFCFGLLFIPITAMGQRLEDGGCNSVRVFGLFKLSLTVYIPLCLSLYSAVSTFSLIPQLTLAASLCPLGKETAFFGVFVGVSHLGQLLSSAISSALLSQVYHLHQGNWQQLTNYLLLTQICPFFALIVLWLPF